MENLFNEIDAFNSVVDVLALLDNIDQEEDQEVSILYNKETQVLSF
jgi:hypothetical protein